MKHDARCELSRPPVGGGRSCECATRAFLAEASPEERAAHQRYRAEVEAADRAAGSIWTAFG